MPFLCSPTDVLIQSIISHQYLDRLDVHMFDRRQHCSSVPLSTVDRRQPIMPPTKSSLRWIISELVFANTLSRVSYVQVCKSTVDFYFMGITCYLPRRLGMLTASGFLLTCIGYLRSIGPRYFNYQKRTIRIFPLEPLHRAPLEC